MSLGIGEGAEQNAPLGRAVIGGLLVATVATLFSCRWSTASSGARAIPNCSRSKIEPKKCVPRSWRPFLGRLQPDLRETQRGTRSSQENRFMNPQPTETVRSSRCARRCAIAITGAAPGIQVFALHGSRLVPGSVCRAGSLEGGIAPACQAELVPAASDAGASGCRGSSDCIPMPARTSPFPATCRPMLKLPSTRGPTAISKVVRGYRRDV